LKNTVRKQRNKIKPATTAFFVALIALTITAFELGDKASSYPIDSKQIEIRGIYGSPEPFWKKNIRFNEIGVNAIFLHHGSINAAMMERAKLEGLKVFAEFATLNGKQYVDQYPEAWPVDNNGEKVKPATWFMGVCPTEPGFKQHRINELKDLLRKFDVDGIWMDYLHWHAQFEDPEPILPETCFCENCLSSFETSSGIKVPDGTTSKKAEWILKNHDSAWRDWRCSVVAEWVRDFKKVLKTERPDALLGIYHCPWDDDDFNGARRKNLGLDYDSLRNIADVFSPMVYHGRMGKNPEWVKENIEWFSTRLNIKAGTFPKVWPIVQAYNDPTTISAEEFEKVLRYGAGGQASGIMMFTSASVAEDDQKVAVMKKVYTGWTGRRTTGK
jgi:hypothetical protein